MAANLSISPAQVQRTKLCEGLLLKIGNDTGHPVIGYGHDLTLAEQLMGKYRDYGITPTQADAILLADMATVEKWLNQRVPADCTQGQFDALCDFCYNVGYKDTLELLAHPWASLPQHIPLYDLVDGKPSAGIEARREQEVETFNS